MRDGECWEQQMSAHRINVIEFGLEEEKKCFIAKSVDTNLKQEELQNLDVQNVNQRNQKLLKWPTPRSCSAMAATITPESAWNENRFPNLETMVGRRMYPTPTASAMPCEGTVRIMRKAWLDGEMSLEEASAIAGRDVRKAQGKVPTWTTPTAHNAKETNAPSESERNTPTLAAQVGGKLNPAWVEWLMGWPLGWTDLKPLETDKYHLWLQQHGKI
jgi:hypothetical protein